MKQKANGSQDPILVSKINPRVYNVVTELNDKLAHLKRTVGNYGQVRPIGPEDMMWVQNFIETGDVVKASFFAYGSKMKNKYHARNKGKQNLNQPMIKQSLTELVNQAEYEDSRLLAELSSVIYDSQNPSDKLRGLDMAFKLKGSYAPEKRVTANANADFGSLTDADLAEQITLFVGEGCDEGGEGLLDEIALRDGEETGPLKL